MNGLMIHFRTSRFNLSKVGPHFINPCCFGEDVAAWLRVKLTGLGIETREPYQEDWGWELPAEVPTGSYFLCMSGISGESSAGSDDGEWGIIIEKKRSIRQLLTGKGKITSDDEMVRTIEEILTEEPTIREVRREQ